MTSSQPVRRTRSLHLEVWIKTVEHNKGGKIVGFGNSQTGIGNYDRHVYGIR